eukprot:CAMPEP_0172319530 /NCGR_PEP_ID=MMETSP1058-20130122/37916_1 /TAXON_ID=83371 /ORGANISM="Detonula confervacea, Strain CCMP 353" /LENGTH=438 /DNA_ID=CAMNT_0013034601 /DNA_START=59 /DNA_END=1375 /DNA_ORIENTATION=-
MRILHLVAVASVFALPRATTAAQDTESEKNDDPLISEFPNLVAWFRSNGGTIDDRVIIGHEPGTKIRGMIATAPIPAETVLIHTPGSIILSSPGGKSCQQIEETVKEMKLGTESKWHSYFEFDDSSGNHIPTQWDRSKGPGRAMKELQYLPPAGDTHSHVDWYKGDCLKGGEMSYLDWKALMMFLTRAADIGLVPLYDLMNHHNGLINTELKRGGDGGLYVIALTDIPANAPIYNTYARSGMESTIDVFNTYGFVEDYPQLWRWNDEKLEELSQENPDHAYHRFGMSNSDNNNDRGDRLHFEPNTHNYEVLVISPTLAALSPSKQLVGILGNGQQSLEEWQTRIDTHHANLRSSHVNALHESVMTLLSELPTTIEEDEVLIPDEKRRLEKVRKLGRVDINKADSIQAIEYRLAFKKALRLAMEVAEKENMFLVDTEEL